MRLRLAGRRLVSVVRRLNSAKSSKCDASISAYLRDDAPHLQLNIPSILPLARRLLSSVGGELKTLRLHSPKREQPGAKVCRTHCGSDHALERTQRWSKSVDGSMETLDSRCMYRVPNGANGGALREIPEVWFRSRLCSSPFFGRLIHPPLNLRLNVRSRRMGSSQYPSSPSGPACSSRTCSSTSPVERPLLSGLVPRDTRGLNLIVSVRA
jgi:hypothetical protein